MSKGITWFSTTFKIRPNAQEISRLWLPLTMPLFTGDCYGSWNLHGLPCEPPQMLFLLPGILQSRLPCCCPMRLSMEQGRIESMGSTLDFPHERFHSKYMQTNSWVALYEAKRGRRVTNPDKGNVLLKVTRPVGGQISRTALLISPLLWS